MHAISSYCGNRLTSKQTHKQMHMQTGLITIHCAAKLSVQCNKCNKECTDAGHRLQPIAVSTAVYILQHCSACFTPIKPALFKATLATEEDTCRHYQTFKLLYTVLTSVFLSICFPLLITLRASCGAVYCNWSCLCVWVCLWFCYHDNSKLRASILSELAL